MKKVLVIEDDRAICDALQVNILTLGLQVDVAWNGASGLEMALENEYALIIVDVMLPRMDGLEVCRRIRQENKVVPILMLTAKSEELDKVVGLESGATDYVTKPFSMAELLARVRSQLRLVEGLRESRVEPEEQVLERGSLTIDLDKKTVIKGNEILELTAKEFDLLALLAGKPGRPFSREEILEAVWGYSVSCYESNIITHINRLRGKIEDDPSRPKFILTRRGVGYLFSDSYKNE